MKDYLKELYAKAYAEYRSLDSKDRATVRVVGIFLGLVLLAVIVTALTN